MNVIICYDVRDNKLRYRLVKYLEKIAVRVQLSVFKANLKIQDIKNLDKFAQKLLQNGAEGNLLIYEVDNEFTGNEQTALPDNVVFF